EGAIGELRSLPFCRGNPPLWVKAKWVRKIPGIMLYHVRADEHGGVRRNEVTADLVLGESPAGDKPDGREQAAGLGEYHGRIRYILEVVGRGESAREHRVEFGMELYFRLGMLREEIPSPRQGAGRGEISGQEESA